MFSGRGCRPWKTTFAPASRNASAAAKPIPCDEPVTSAALFPSENAFILQFQPRPDVPVRDALDDLGFVRLQGRHFLRVVADECEAFLAEHRHVAVEWRVRSE